jgi:hypothetical protein
MLNPRLDPGGPASRALDGPRAVDGGDAVLEASEPAAGRRLHAADAVVLDGEHEGVGGGHGSDADGRGTHTYFATSVSASAATKYSADATELAATGSDRQIVGHQRGFRPRLVARERREGF